MGWLEQKFGDMMLQFCTQVINDLLKLIVQILDALLVNPANMNVIPGFTALQTSLQGLATVAIGVIAAKELTLNNFEELGDMAVSPVIILRNSFVAVVLVWLSPLLITQFILPLTRYLTYMIDGSLASNLSIDLYAKLHVSDAGTNALVGYTTTQLSGWAILFLTVGIIICFLIIGIQSGIRWAELIFLALLGPVLAVTKASFGSQWNMWLRETISTAISQVVQYFSVLIALNIMLHPGSLDAMSDTHSVAGTVKIVMIFGILIFSITGPKVLRGLISSGSPTGMKAVGAMFNGAASAVGKGVGG